MERARGWRLGGPGGHRFWGNEPLTADYARRLGSPVFAQHTGGDAIFEPDRSARRRLDGNPIDAPSSRFTLGAQDLALRLAERIGRGTVHLGEAVHAVEVGQHGVEVHSTRGRRTAEHLVLALPPPLVVEQISCTPALPLHIRAAAESTSVWMGEMVKAVAVFDHPAWRDLGLAGAAMSYVGPFREFHDHSGPEGAPAALFGFAPSALMEPFDTHTAERHFRSQLRSLFAGTLPEPIAVEIVNWRDERYTSPRRPAAGAGTRSYGSPALRETVHGRIVLASTETASAFAGHVEGPLLAGRTAAASLLTMAGRSAV